MHTKTVHLRSTLACPAQRSRLPEEAQQGSRVVVGSQGRREWAGPWLLQGLVLAGLHNTSPWKHWFRASYRNNNMALLCQSMPMLADSTHSSIILSALCDQCASGLFCDVTIVVEDIKFRAHRNVLAASSGYFRNALSEQPEVWTSGQVLELLDLRSEVFARILNFIYSSKVVLTSLEDVRALVAAGKRLGIPFLEKITVTENNTPQSAPQNQSSSLPNRTPLATGPRLAKKKVADSSRGPRITNAFSITEIAAGNNPFSPLDPDRDGQQSSMDPSSLPVGCPAPDSLSETLHTLADHSYAVSLGEGVKDSTLVHWHTYSNTHSQSNVTTGAKTNQVCSPLKKRHKLWGSLDEKTPSSPGTPMQKLNVSVQTATISHSVPAIKASSPVSSPSNSNTEKTLASEQLKTTQTPPPSPTPTPAVPSESVQSCKPHSEVPATPTHIHRRRNRNHPGLLFCRFCHRKFMHLKRLRNHEQVCGKGPNRKEASSGSTFVNTFPPTADHPETAEEAGERAGAGVRTLRGPKRAYLCSVCKRTYVTLSSLRRHENVHSWQRAYPCHYCNKVFALAEYRTKHEIWHTGERRYQCIFCLETFMTYYILKNHQKAFHGIDPRLSVNRKSVNGVFKSSIYPIKLYRLLPMKFRQRRYRKYAQSFSETTESHDPAFPIAPSCSSPSATFGGEGLPILSDAVTFMATPNMVAPVQPTLAEAQACLLGGGTSPSLRENSHISLFHKQGTSINSHGFALPPFHMQTSREPSMMNENKDLGSDAQYSTGNDHCFSLPPVLKMNTNVTLGQENGSTEDLLDAVQCPLQDRGHIVAHAPAIAGKTVTYLAKPACPGPSNDSRVPPLCQITVKIGNEAIVRRSIDGSNLIPRKRRIRHSIVARAEEEGGKDGSKELHFSKKGVFPGTERTSFREAELCDDGGFCDEADSPWRPYYSYKSKRKAKRLRSKDRKGGRCLRLRRPMDKDEELGLGKTYSLEQNFPLNAADIMIGVQKTQYTCNDCQTTFPSLSTLQRHTADCCPGERGKVCTCRTCGKPLVPGEVAGDDGDLTCSTCIGMDPILRIPLGFLAWNAATAAPSAPSDSCTWQPGGAMSRSTWRSVEKAIAATTAPRSPHWASTRKQTSLKWMRVG
ncbi:hypothetical protein AGOR_G00237260 [Albula goreensis]|uniref:Uncharacterized protein n=1 Tax=Albula goreensis TaxID=1534307 RepID=A0A8T3CJ12_9TELE|nr:hypothetical protein AGOR_G00237260 [Albula goreensis]